MKTTTFLINDGTLLVDIDETKAFYLTQDKITNDCMCEDCLFYATVFTRKPLEIFKMLSSMGIDLEKNLQSEPTGVWCIRDEQSNFLHCQQVYQTVGQITSADTSQLKYEQIENGYKVNALFLNAGDSKVDIVLSIDKV